MEGSDGAAGGESESLHGRFFDCRDVSERRRAIEFAFDYRGDVAVALEDGEVLTGFLSNRDLEANPPFVEVFPSSGQPRRRIDPRRIISIEFTGIDTAAGKSWQAWLEKVAEAEKNGAIAELYPEKLDE